MGCGSSGVSCRPAKPGPAAARQAASRALASPAARVPGAGRSLGPARCDTGPVGTGPMWHRTGYGAVSRPALTPQEPHPCDIAVVADEARCGLLRRKLLVGLQAETGRAYPGS